MKRNMELIKQILLDLEDHCTPHGMVEIKSSDYHDVSEPEVTESCRLISERGLAHGTLSRDGWRFSALTWDGHDFLDNARENKIWQSAKDAAGNLSFGVFKKVLYKTAVAFALDKLGIK